MVTIHPEIYKAIQNDSLVFFIGSGFSRQLGLPDWNGLLKDIIQALLPTNPSYNILMQTLDAGFLTEIEVLDKIQKHKKEALDILAQTFQLDEEKTSKLHNHKKLWKISQKFITTNYDKALETANPSTRKVVFDNDYYMAKLNNEDNYVFKLHGCIEDPTKCILFEESYKELYNGHSAAIETLKKIGSDKTIIFLGFSLSDPYVKKQFEYINDIYKGMQKQHFIVTTSNEKFENYVEPIKIDNWGEALDKLLESLIIMKESVMQTSSTQMVEVSELTEQHEKDEIKKTPGSRMSFLIATPINKQFDYDFAKIASYFSNLKVTIDFAHLSVEALNNLVGYDYLFLFTETMQEKIFIEDDNFKARPFSLKDLENEILDDQIKGIFLFVNKEIEIDNTDLSLPIVVEKFGNGNLSRFVFSTFRKAKKSLLNEAIIINPEHLKLTQVESGSATINKKKSPMGKQIEPKNLKTFIGRTTDLEILVREIRDLKQSVLTIKGSGGLGKTTIVKKLAVELADRNYFEDGIFFVDCENIVDFQSFEYKVAMCFNLENAIDLMEYIKQNERKLNSLMIFDNFESLLYIEKEEDIAKIKDLVSFVCDYATVVITSREWVGFDYEERYELRLFTTDEAVDLFLKYYRHTIDEADMKILRSDILENLLNNNPLAIKIIAMNIPKTKNMLALKKDLETDFFNTLQTGFEDIFIKEADFNIERSKSLYQSINYSYSKLTPREKLAFEILCLFPDGIQMETYKNFFQSKELRLDINRISDRDIKSLENKSLVEITNGLLRLQSIVGRFAEHQFNRRTSNEKSSYFKRAFQYIYFIVNVIRDMSNDDNLSAHVGEISENNKENYFKCLDYLGGFNSYKDRKLKLITHFQFFVRSIDQRNRFEQKTKRLKEHFKDVVNSELLIDLVIHVSKFLHYSGKFEDSFDGLVKLIPMHKIEALSNKNLIDDLIISWSLQAYSIIGKTYDVIKYMITNDCFDEEALFSVLFYLGLYKIFDSSEPYKLHTFFKFESKYNQNLLELHTLEEYLNNIFEKDFTEVMQVNYLKAKMGYQTVENVIKLVVVNPYTLGLKNLMLAFLETDTDRAIFLYTEAIKNLDYVKYYQTEAIFFFSRFLKGINSTEYQEWFDRGYTSAKECAYRYLIHCFECLMTGEDEPFNEHKHELPDKLDVEEFIRKNRKNT